MAWQSLTSSLNKPFGQLSCYRHVSFPEAFLSILLGLLVPQFATDTLSTSGGTNLRVGFVHLLAEGREVVNGNSSNGDGAPRLRRLLEQSWPIGEALKHENSDSLFSWIGECIAHVIAQACKEWDLSSDQELPMGVTFSFPMIQRSLSEATLMSMGKGFAITSQLDLAQQLLAGYRKHQGALPSIRIAAIANDAVSTLVSFLYQFQAGPNQKAAMGIICGTGTNATIPLRLSSLKESKRPEEVSMIPGQADEDVRIAVNTEWSINGTEPPLRELGFVSHWDKLVDQAGERPGFQPLEYMTSGRYLGELGRVIFVDYLTQVLDFKALDLPASLQRRFGLSTAFLSHYKPTKGKSLLEQLENEFPLWEDKENMQGISRWTEDIADALYQIAIAIEVRAAGIVAASTMALLACAEEIPLPEDKRPLELVVGYTGGCITGFQSYLQDCQDFLDKIVAMEFGTDHGLRVVLSPCHDGGITGAGILVPASLQAERT